MIDRTTLDLRLADHRATTTRIGASDWQFQRATHHRSGRTQAVAALRALVARLARVAHTAAHGTIRQAGHDVA